MRHWWRRMRGLAGLGPIGALLGGTLGAGITAVAALMAWGRVPIASLVAGTVFGALLGCATTTGFGVLLAVTSTGRSVEEPSVRWGMAMSALVAARRHVVVVVMGSWSLFACTPAGDGTGGPIRFETAVFLEDSAATSANVSAGDINGDGHMDLVLVKGRHWPLVDVVLLGDGRGGFEPPYSVGPQPDRSYSGVLVDLDRDGDLDVVVSNDQPDPKVVHLNDGGGRFVLGSSFGRPEWSTRHVAVADFDRDSAPDVVLANRYGEETGPSFICFGDGAGGFDAPCVEVTLGSATTITPADIDGDGAPDLVVPHRDGGQSYVYLNDGSGRFDDVRPFGPPGAAIRSAKAADFDGDGLLDLAVIDERTGPAVYRGAPDGTFSSATALGDVTATPYAIEVADLDQNGSSDIIVGHVEHHPVAYLNDGVGGFSAVAFGDDVGVAYGFAVADFDEDGILDIAMARSDARNVLYFGSRAARSNP